MSPVSLPTELAEYIITTRMIDMPFAVSIQFNLLPSAMVIFLFCRHLVSWSLMG
jgi:hypothetical protein